MNLRARILPAITAAAFLIPKTALPLILQHQAPIAQNAVASGPVDINTASLDQLMRLPGLTRTWAARIIRYRPYRGKNELLDHGVLTTEVYARIKDRIIAHRQAR